jgi:hypothetical protein
MRTAKRRDPRRNSTNPCQAAAIRLSAGTRERLMKIRNQYTLRNIDIAVAVALRAYEGLSPDERDQTVLLIARERAAESASPGATS